MRTKLGFMAIGLLVAAIVIFAPHSAHAQNGENNNDSTDSTSTSENTGSGSSSNSSSSPQSDEAAKQAAEQAKHQAEQLAEQRKQAEEQRQETLKKAEETQNEQAKQAAEKANEAFTKVCEGKREGFKTRLESIDTNAQRIGEKLNNIDARIEAYVSQKKLTVANYTTLLTAVKTQQQLLQSVIEVAKQKAESFTCGTSKDDAKSSTQAFRDVLQQEIDVIKAYKTALKNLIVAVKAAAQQGATSNGSAQ